MKSKDNVEIAVGKCYIDAVNKNDFHKIFRK